MQNFIKGQRWISDTELHMGLGTVLEVDYRSVTIVFIATGETRIYAKQSAPLTRVELSPGATIHRDQNNRLRVTALEYKAGIITYHGIDSQGNEASLDEGELDNFLALNRPTDRLFNGHIDHNSWFELRYQTRINANQRAHSELEGLTGVRTSLIPHQLYIAHEVANRFAPRVLLADEVGLGKTIEAGLILHHQLLTERARRIVIVVPESLVHQWFVEMIRRFNLHFSIFDEERCRAEASANDENPFFSAQLVLCHLDFLVKNSQRYSQVVEGNWDLLVVDEAHHLQWSPEQASKQYTLIEEIAAKTSGVLLLTATPEQFGKASHFARLRLLDPDRFPSYEAFVKEEQSYEPIAHVVEALFNDETLSTNAIQTLKNIIKEESLNSNDTASNIDLTQLDNAAYRVSLIDQLLDRHGTGRVLFRNTRNTIKGFPQRKVTAYPLPLPKEYQSRFNELSHHPLLDLPALLCPELLFPSDDTNDRHHWTQFDPRVDWLARKLNTLKLKKVLVITANAHTALALAQVLRSHHGISAAVFHELLSITERDRAAAFFADHENGSQVLVCSEMGSEGRNFQFSHHLILFDLPLNPDLLEQRIGRLDRIGQQDTINIHVPYLEHSPQAVLFRWYQEGLDAFEHTCPAGSSVYASVYSALHETLLRSAEKNTQAIDDLVDSTQTLHLKLNHELQRGRDKLLEYNSCRPQMANRLTALAINNDSDSQLQVYMTRLFDCYGVDVDDKTATSYVIRPSDHLYTSTFPGLPDDGLTVTYDRNTALVHEDIQYLTWEHPLVRGAMDLVLSTESGNTAMTTVKSQALESGTLLLECIYHLQSASNESLQPNRYLPPTSLRVVVDQYGNDCSAIISQAMIDDSQFFFDKATIKKVIHSQKESIQSTVEYCDQLSQKQAQTLLSKANNKIENTLDLEINRLLALQKINPNVREEEIQFLQTQRKSLTDVLKSAVPRLDAVRIIINLSID